MKELEQRLTVRRDRMSRTLAVNAFWGIDSESHCHDLTATSSTTETTEPLKNEEGYVVSMDLETGELSIKTLSPE